MSLFEPPPEYARLREKEPYIEYLERVAYRNAVGHDPINPPEGSEAWNQWVYTGRKKKDKDTLKTAGNSL